MGARTDVERLVRGRGAHVVVVRWDRSVLELRVERQGFATLTAQCTPGVQAGESYRY